MSKPAFPGIEPIRYQPDAPANALAFRYYDKDKKVRGKRMEDHLRMAVCYWHTFVWNGFDVFGAGTFGRAWHRDGDAVELAKEKAAAAFELFGKLGVPFFCFHDRDVAPEGQSLAETNDILDRITDVLEAQMKQTGTKLLWGTANLFSHPRYMGGAATNPDPEVFTFAAAQVKKALEITQRLGGANYVLWGGREGYETLLNTDMKRELDQLGPLHEPGRRAQAQDRLQGPAADRAEAARAHEAPVRLRLGDGARVLPEVRPRAGRLPVNIEANHATLAGHSFEHEVAYALVRRHLRQHRHEPRRSAAGLGHRPVRQRHRRAVAGRGAHRRGGRLHDRRLQLRRQGPPPEQRRVGSVPRPRGRHGQPGARAADRRQDADATASCRRSSTSVTRAGTSSSARTSWRASCRWPICPSGRSPTSWIPSRARAARRCSRPWSTGTCRSPRSLYVRCDCGVLLGERMAPQFELRLSRLRLRRPSGRQMAPQFEDACPRTIPARGPASRICRRMAARGFVAWTSARRPRWRRGATSCRCCTRSGCTGRDTTDRMGRAVYFEAGGEDYSVFASLTPTLVARKLPAGWLREKLLPAQKQSTGYAQTVIPRVEDQPPGRRLRPPTIDGNIPISAQGFEDLFAGSGVELEALPFADVFARELRELAARRRPRHELRPPPAPAPFLSVDFAPLCRLPEPAPRRVCAARAGRAVPGRCCSPRSSRSRESGLRAVRAASPWTAPSRSATAASRMTASCARITRSVANGMPSLQSTILSLWRRRPPPVPEPATAVDESFVIIPNSRPPTEARPARGLPRVRDAAEPLPLNVRGLRPHRGADAVLRPGRIPPGEGTCLAATREKRVQMALAAPDEMAAGRSRLMRARRIDDDRRDLGRARGERRRGARGGGHDDVGDPRGWVQAVSW